MELDPRLTSDSAGEHGVSSKTAARPASSSAPSPSTQLAQTANLPPPHRGQENADTPSSTTIGSTSTPGKHEHHGGQEGLQQQQQGVDQDGGDAKKARACEACRGLKVRCEPDPVEGEPCKRCRKAGRNCVVTMPTRKRQKKTDSRVSELEKKIDALTASLQARAAAPGGPPFPATGSAAGQHRHASESSAGSGYGPGWGGGGPRPWGDMETSPLMQSAPTPGPVRTSQDHTDAYQPPIVMAGQKRKAHESHGSSNEERKSATTTPAAWSGFSRPNEGDIVDRGLITMEDAASLFCKYMDHMVKHLPAVVFPPSTTVMELRKTKPTLFLAIMAAATGEDHSLQRVLQKELMQLFAEKVIVTGEKNLELVQAIHVAVIWYWPPEHFEELKFYQLIHIAAVMAIDIGLGRKCMPKRGPPPLRHNPRPDPTSIECRRTWLTCFFLALNTSMSMHRPNLIRWAPFMAESIEILETSPEAAPTDKYFCHLVWTHRLAEEVGAQFSLDDPSAMVNITDVRTQYALRALERDFDKYFASVPNNMMQPSLRLGFSTVNLYMHEMALHTESSPDQWRPPFNTDALKDGIVSSEPLSASHINALSACLTSIDGIFDTFLSMDVLSIRCLPVFNFMRVAYGVVILIKMYFSASSPDSEMGKVINKDNMRVEYYLEALLEKFRATAADNKCRPATKFLVVLAMLRSWFFKQGKGGGRDSGSAGPDATLGEGASSSSSHQMRHQSQGGSQPQQQEQQLPQQPIANTPLQLLSEVATGRDSNNRRLIFGTRHVSQPFFHDSVSSTDTPPPGSASTCPLPQIPGGSSSASGSASGPATDLDPAMAPAFQSWMSSTAAGTQAMPLDLDMGVMPSDFDFEGLGMTVADSQDVYENGARIVMNEPWFSSAFQGLLPDPNLFPF